MTLEQALTWCQTHEAVIYAENDTFYVSADIGDGEGKTLLEAVLNAMNDGPDL